MNKQSCKAYLKGVLPLFTGELIVALLTVGVFLLIDGIWPEREFFDYTVPTGAFLGFFVIIVNFLILSISVNRAVNSFIKERGEGEMTDEDAEAFAETHKSRVQLAVARSYIIRTVIMIGTLVGAFLLEWFNPIATVIPLLTYKPVIYVTELIKSKKGE